MGNRRTVRIGLILLVVLAISSVVACQLRAPGSISVRYSVDVPASAAKCIIVQAHISGISAGPSRLLLLDEWGDACELSGQIRWMRVGEVQGVRGEVGTETVYGDASVAAWNVDVPRGGEIDVEYCVDLSGEDGTVPSGIWSDHGLLLSRSLFVFPAAWLDDLRAPFDNRVSVGVSPPEDWAVHAPWITDETGVFRPESLEDLLDAGIALGNYRGYVLQDGAFRVRLLMPPTANVRLSERRVGELGRGILSVYRFFGSAPEAMDDDLLTVFVDDSHGLPSSNPTAVALSDHQLLVSTNDTLSPGLREATLGAAFSLWSGAALRGTPPWADAALDPAAWLGVGATEYFVQRMLVDSDAMSSIAYWNQVRGTIRDMDEASSSLADAVVQMRHNPTLEKLVRDKGHLAALRLDQHIRTRSDSQRGLADVLVKLCGGGDSSDGAPFFTEQEVLSVLEEIGGEDCTALYRRLTYSEGTLGMAGIPQLSGPPAGEMRTIIAPDGTELVYQWLDGPTDRTAVYLSGGPGLPPYAAMHALAAPLQHSFDVAYLDQRGCGRSDGLGPGGYSVDAFVDDVEVLRQDLGAQRISLLGHGWGGYCSLLYASRYPECVDHLILFSPVPSFPRVVEAGLGLLGEKDDSLGAQRLLSEGVRNHSDLQRLGMLLDERGAFGSDLQVCEDALIKAYDHYRAAFVLPEGLQLYNDNILPTLLARDHLLSADALGELTPGGYSVLIVHGEGDEVISLELLHELQKRVGGEIAGVQGAGHLMHLEKPDVVAEEIAAFLERTTEE